MLKFRDLRKKLTVVLLTLFLFMPVAQVFADDAAPTAVSTVPDSSVAPVSAVPATDTSPAPAAPTTPAAANPSAAPASTDSVTAPRTGNAPALPPGSTPAQPYGSNAPAQPTTAPAGSLSPSSGSNYAVPNLYSAGQVAQPKIDKNTGALTYSYPIAVPPGRDDLQPNITLDYNSQKTEDGSAFGRGWNISIPYIERVNRTGINNLYSQNYYTSSVCGDLISADNTNFGCRTENGDFLKFVYSGSTWTVTDKKGTTYLYGSSAATRLDNPGNSAQIYRWMLEKVTDTNNNYIKYSYTKDSGQIYPSQIIYTGNGTIDGPFTVTFTTQSRTDQYQTYKTGFAVTSNYRISEIDTNINGVWVHKYVLAYTTGDNGYRSMLSSITETGKDESGTSVNPPATQFSYTKSTLSWTQTTIQNPPLQSDANMPSDYMLGNVVDNTLPIKGNGLPDIVESDAVGWNWTSGTWGDAINNIYTNTGTNAWSLASGLNPPYQIQGQDQRGGWGGIFNQGVSLADLNGDGLPDFIKSQSGANGAYKAYLNNGGTGWVQNANWTPTIPITDSVDTQNGGTPTDFGTRVLDLNGDGLADIIRIQSNPASVQLNTGTGFGSVSTSWTNQIPRIYYPQTRELDLNGDGIVDFSEGYYFSGTYVPKALMGDGNGNYTQNSNYNPPLSYTTQTNNCDLYSQYLDINGDGLPDYLRDYQWNSTCQEGFTTGAWGYYLNTGNGWASTPMVYLNCNFGGGNFQTGLTAIMVEYNFLPVDVNGDGLLDYVGTVNNAGGGHTTYAFVHNGVVPDLLSQITYSQGGSSSFTYKGTPQYKDGSNNLLNPNLPFILQTVSSIVTNDGSGNTATASYSYQGGTYYYSSATDRKFAGFQKVVVTDPAGNVTNIYYHTQNGTDASHGEYNDNYYKIGKPYRVESYDASSNLYKGVINKWDSATLSTGGGFAFLAQTLEKDYDGGANHNDKATAYTYDNTTGNVLTQTEYGQVTGNDDGTFTDTGTDKYTTTYTYASGGAVVGLPDDAIVVNQSSTKVKESKYYYDNAAFGSVTKGNLTEQDDWISGTSYAVSTKTYDGTYGLVTQSKDPNNNPTNNTYDANNLYPATVTNALNQATQYTYNYQYGKVDQTTDPNGFIFKNIYDGLGRVTTIQQPDQTTPTTLANKTTYTYTDTSGAVAIQQNDWMDGTNSIATYTYFDGLNRKIQQRSSAEDSGNYNVKDFWYNNRGLLSQESLPYVSTGSAKTSPTTAPTLLIQYAYDPLQRLTTTTNALGTTTNAYAPWKVTVTDANNHAKDLLKDAYDNLIQVNEYNGSTYSTTYAYDYLKDLTNITDANGNVRNFIYDGLGRRLTAQDLHPSTSSTFGTWNYTYDNAGNLTQIVDINSNTINYVYDALNRQTNEKLGTTNKVTYTYDTGCTNGIGRLCQVANPTVTTTNTYNALGFITQEVKNINSTNYQTSYTYDRQQHPLTITNPDNSVIQYTYNLAGLAETVQRKESGDALFTNFVTNLDYSPLNGISVIAFADGANTTNTYDSTKLYRLTQKLTTLGGNNIQNIAYVYDPVGNITSIADTSTTDTKKNIAYGYDNLNRLTSYTVTSAANGNNHSETYTYDALGNITSKSDQGAYTYGGTGYPNPDAVRSIGSTSFTYDNNGNLLTNGTLTNTWDYNNRLTQSVVGGSNPITESYSYDQTGERVTLGNGVVSTYYLSKYYNIDSLGNKTKHIFAGSLNIGDIVNPPASGSGTTAGCTPPTTGDWTVSASCTFTGFAIAPANVIVSAGQVLTLSPRSKLLIDFKHYKLLVKATAGLKVKKYAQLRQAKPSDQGVFVTSIATDHLTGSNIVVDSTGTIQETQDYYPFGSLRLNEESTFFSEQRKFAGHEYDPDTSLSYQDARYLNPVIGRWLSEDPAVISNPEKFISDPQQLNSYSYVGNNPIIRIDPTGKFFIVDDVIEASIGLAALYTVYVAPAVEEAVPYVQTAFNGFLGYQTYKAVVNNDKNAADTAGLLLTGSADIPGFVPGENTNVYGDLQNTASEAGLQTSKEPLQLQIGKQAHKDFPIEPGYQPEVTTPSGKRMDRYNPDTGHIIEIKPNNPRAIRQGEKQVQGYVNEMQQSTNQPHSGEVRTYDPSIYTNSH